MKNAENLTVSGLVGRQRCVWNVQALVDDDGHLNLYVTTDRPGDNIQEIETGQGDGQGEQLALRLTSDRIESHYQSHL